MLCRWLGGCLRDLRATRDGGKRAETRAHLFFPLAQNHDTLPPMDQCSQALNSGAGPTPSAENSLSIPALSPDSLDAGLCAPAPAYQIHTESRLPFVRFAWKTASNVRKNIFFVRLCPFRTINIPKTNTLWGRLYADCLVISPANIQLSSSRLALRKTTPLGALTFPGLLDARQKWLCLRATRDGEKGPGDGIENMFTTPPPDAI